MKGKYFLSIPFAFVLCLGWSLAWADDDDFPENASFTTLIVTPLPIEGLTGDNNGNLYTGGNAGTNCPIWRINLSSPSLVPVGTIPGTCNPLGIAFNDLRDLFVANGATGTIHTFTPNAAFPPNATVFAFGVPGANGIAFDSYGNLWVSDGVQNLGRVWKITPGGTVTEAFRIQAMANDLNPAVTGDISNVGSDRRTLPPGTIGTLGAALRTATNVGNSQNLVANGLAFNEDGDILFISDTARGAIWRVKLDSDGNLKSPTGCDTTFTANTLCLSNIFVTHPILEGADGIALDKEGNIWVDANERNAVAFVTKDGRVLEVFRNPVNPDTKLRNKADVSTDTPTQAAEKNSHILEFPTSPFLSGRIFCTANSDGNRRDNFPNSDGEIKPAGPNRGKISCMDQELEIRGLRLPID